MAINIIIIILFLQKHTRIFAIFVKADQRICIADSS